MSAARSLVRRLSFATVLCSSSFGVVGEVCRLRSSGFGASPLCWFCCGVFYVFMYRSGRVGRVPAILLCGLFCSSCSPFFHIWQGW